MINKVYFYLIIATLMVCSCSPSELETKEYVAWVKDYENGIHKKKTVAGLTFDVQYKPVEYIALVETRGADKNKELFQKRLKELEGMEYIELRIVSDNGDFIKGGSSSGNEANQKLYYFSFDFQNDIQLQQGTKKTSCKLYHFERAYDLTKEKRFLLGFEKNDTLKGERILIIDSPLLGSGTVKIKFEAQDLENIPLLRI